MRCVQNRQRCCDVVYQAIFKGPPEVAVKGPVTVAHAAKFYHEGTLKSCSAVLSILLKRCVPDDNIAKQEVKLRNL